MSACCSAAAVTFVAATAAAAGPFVSVDAKLIRSAVGAVVSGQVVWDQAAAAQAPDYMSVGDVRLVAVSDHGHRPTLLATAEIRPDRRGAPPRR